MAAQGFDLGALVAACRDLASRAGKLISTIYENGDLNVVEKMYGENKKLTSLRDILNVKDPMTMADEMAQKLICGSLRKQFPKLKVCGEEGDLDCQESDIVTPNLKHDMNIPRKYKNIDIKDLVVWVGMFFLFSISHPYYPCTPHSYYYYHCHNKHCMLLSFFIFIFFSRFVFPDPVDGTKEFTEGIKSAVTTLIGIAWKGRPIAGIIGRPFTDEIIWGIVGLGAFGFKNKDKLQTRDRKSRVIVTTRTHLNQHIKGYVCACKPSNFKRAGGSGGKTLMVIEGDADAYVFPAKGIIVYLCFIFSLFFTVFLVN